MTVRFRLRAPSTLRLVSTWLILTFPSRRAVESCTILTTTPNLLLADVHDRMPVILAPANYGRWLDPSMQDVAIAVGLLRPFDPKLMRRYPVSTRVNLVANDDPECSAPSPSAGSNCHALRLIGVCRQGPALRVNERNRDVSPTSSHNS